jgi:2-dehydro-3-deoxygluconokinase
MFDVTALGEGMVEFNQARPGERAWLQGFGGDTSNAVIAAARAGARAAYLSRVGGDEFGSLLLDLWRAEGVDTSAVDRDADAPTGLYFVTHGSGGHSFSYRRSGSAATRMTTAWIERPEAQQVLRSTRFLHVSGISMAISPDARECTLVAMRHAREAGARVSLDANLRTKLWPLEQARAAIDHALRRCDVYLPSLEDAAALHGTSDPAAIADCAHRAGVCTVVIKLGADGCVVSEGGRLHHVHGHRVHALDATGAGDCFSGNLLARLAAGDDTLVAARYANAAAALAVQGWGAVDPLPRPDAVRGLA